MNSSTIQFISQPLPVSMADDWFAIAGVNHFWMQWRFKEIKKILSKVDPKKGKILEIGCGSGTVIKQFSQDMGIQVDGCDLNEYALKQVKGVKSNVFCYNIFDHHPDMMNKYSGIFLLDVIEHIDDDVAFLNASVKHIKKGDWVVVNVPAYNHLFSKYDTEAGHQRRYTKSTLKSTFEKAGVEPVKIKYWGGMMYPLAVARKMFLSTQKEQIIKSGFHPPNEFLHSVLKGTSSFETSFPFNLPFGTSVMGFGIKK